MATNITNQLSYFEELARTCIDIQHTEDKPGFFAFDFKAMMATRIKQETIMFLHTFQGGYTDKNSDNVLDESRIQWSILQQIDESKFNSAESIIEATKAICEKIIARMLWHKEEDPSHEYCEMLMYFDLDKIEYRIDEIYLDNWTGYRVITPLVGNADLTMNPTDWIE